MAATTPDPARAVDAVRDALDPDMRDRVRISVSRPGVVGRPARVTATVAHPLVGPILDNIKVNISADAAMYVER